MKFEFRSEFFNAFNIGQLRQPDQHCRIGCCGTDRRDYDGSPRHPVRAEVQFLARGPRRARSCLAWRMNLSGSNGRMGMVAGADSTLISNNSVHRGAMTLEKFSQQGLIRVTRSARGRVSGDGVELAFGYWPGRGLPVVALHGLTASHMNFVGIAERLSGRCAFVALDLRGRGDSDKPEGPYGMEQHARDVAESMRAMGLGASIIVGHSMGAFVATALAAQAAGVSCPASF